MWIPKNPGGPRGFSKRLSGDDQSPDHHSQRKSPPIDLILITSWQLLSLGNRALLFAVITSKRVLISSIVQRVKTWWNPVGKWGVFRGWGNDVLPNGPHHLDSTDGSLVVALSDFGFGTCGREDFTGALSDLGFETWRCVGAGSALGFSWKDSLLESLASLMSVVSGSVTMDRGGIFCFVMTGMCCLGFRRFDLILK